MNDFKSAFIYVIAVIVNNIFSSIGKTQMQETERGKLLWLYVLHNERFFA